MKLAVAVLAGGVVVAVALTGYVVYELSRAEVVMPGLATTPDIDCNKAKPLTAPTLAQFYEDARDLAIAWRPDAVPVRLDNLAMTAPLQPDGSSRLWTASFHSPSAEKAVLVHSGDGSIHCSTVPGQVTDHVPALKGELMRDGAALYKVADKNGKALLAKGLGVGINLWASGDDGHATWQIAYYDRQGYPAGPRIIVNATTGAVEGAVK